MPKPARTSYVDSTTLGNSAPDSDVLHFLSRTLQAHYSDTEPRDMLAKLQNLKTALDQQELTLLDWPDSPSKDRICAALTKARNLVTQIVDELGAVAQKRPEILDARAYESMASRR